MNVPALSGGGHSVVLWMTWWRGGCAGPGPDSACPDKQGQAGLLFSQLLLGVTVSRTCGLQARNGSILFKPSLLLFSVYGRKIFGNDDKTNSLGITSCSTFPTGRIFISGVLSLKSVPGSARQNQRNYVLQCASLRGYGWPENLAVRLILHSGCKTTVAACKESSSKLPYVRHCPCRGFRSRQAFNGVLGRNTGITTGTRGQSLAVLG